MKWLQTKWFIPSIIIIIGIGLRFFVTSIGHNFDFDSYLIVREIAKHGGNVYAQTDRYNYGPVWFFIIFILDGISPFFQNNFRYILVGFLSLVDVGIFFILLKKIGGVAAYLFFLNPISIIITGYHNQFDNLAILLGLIAIVVYGDNFSEALSPRKLTGLFLLGLSIMTKHLLFAFPLWLATKQKGLLNKAFVLFIPISIFALSFLIFWKDGQQGIVQNVLLYKSFNNQPFYYLLVPKLIQRLINAKLTWYFLLSTFAIVFRKQKSLDSLLLYLCLLVTTSPAIANQYLVIPIIFIAAYPNIFFLLYTVIGTWYLLIDDAALHVATLQSIAHFGGQKYYFILIILLFLGFVWHVWQQNILAFIKNGVVEIKNALA